MVAVEHHLMHRIFILGPQGSGKGTQARKLSEFLGIPHLSMGQLLREEAERGGELGDKIRGYVDHGVLVPDEVAKLVLVKRLEAPDARAGYILDGFPRNRAQYDGFQEFDQPTAVVVISISRETSMKRLLKRAEIEGRVDDTPEVIAKRLDTYERETLPIIDEYRERGIVRDVDGEADIEEVAKRIQKLFVL